MGLIGQAMEGMLVMIATLTATPTPSIPSRLEASRQCVCYGFFHCLRERDGIPWYSEPCAAGVVVTYSSGSGTERSIVCCCSLFILDSLQVSVDLHHGCTEAHSGTSAAAPLAAGILALVLQAKFVHDHCVLLTL